jgi:hypothetical protein
VDFRQVFYTECVSEQTVKRVAVNVIEEWRFTSEVWIGDTIVATNMNLAFA